MPLPGRVRLSFTRKLQIWGAAFTAVFIGLFRHADALATAMDARCYHGGTGRTRLHPLRFSKVDVLATAVFALLFAGVITANCLF